MQCLGAVSRSSPFTFQWPCGSEHVLSAPSPQRGDEGVLYVFREWSDGGEQTHRIIANQSETITAAYATLYRLTVASEPPEGVGLGMREVLRVIAEHDACIRVTSAPGRGATVRVSLGMARSLTEAG